MQNTVIREFQDDPRVVTAVFQEGGRFGEEMDWVKTFWRNYYLRGTVIFDPDASAGKNYRVPDGGLPFRRGFIIDQDGKVAEPFFGYDPERIIQTIYRLLEYIRGDVNGDGGVDISDAVRIIFYLFSDYPVSPPGAADVNDDGEKNLTDVIYLLDYLFKGGSPPPPPFPDPGSG